MYTFHPVHLIPFLRVMQLFREKKRKGNLSLRFLKLATSTLDEIFLVDFRVASQVRGQKKATTRPSTAVFCARVSEITLGRGEARLIYRRVVFSPGAEKHKSVRDTGKAGTSFLDLFNSLKTI